MYSQENALASEERAVLCENEHEDDLSSNEKKENFFKEVNKLLKYRTSNLEHIYEHFDIEETRFLFDKNIPLWHLERFTTEKAKALKVRLNKIEDKMNEAFTNLLNGKIDLYLKDVAFYFNGMSEITIARDQEIARNIVEAEDRIRQRYPLLRNVDPLRLMGSIGHLHTPEEVTSRVKVILIENYDHDLFCSLMSNYIRSKKTEETFTDEPALLRFGLYGLDCTKEYIEKLSDQKLFEALYNVVASGRR